MGKNFGRSSWNEFIRYNEIESDLGNCGNCGARLKTEDVTFKCQTLGPSVGHRSCVRCLTTKHSELEGDTTEVDHIQDMVNAMHGGANE